MTNKDKPSALFPSLTVNLGGKVVDMSTGRVLKPKELNEKKLWKKTR